MIISKFNSLVQKLSVLYHMYYKFVSEFIRDHFLHPRTFPPIDLLLLLRVAFRDVAVNTKMV
jgi:hypothetical protein